MQISTIAFIRDTDVMTDELLIGYVKAQQIQITRDFAPCWGAGATCIFVQPNAIPTGAWQVWFKDHSDQAGALGYHDDNGNPIAYVFAGDDRRDGLSWTVTGSHETLEMLGDPDIQQVRDVNGFEYAYEACDACEDDQFSYPVAGVLMSDFVLPSWFDPDGEAPFTFRNSIQAPLTLAAGGYIGVRSLPDGQWQQRFAELKPVSPRQRKGRHSRTMRRFGNGALGVAVA